MFNFEAIDKTPTVIQIKAIIKYMENEPNVNFDFEMMMDMERHKRNKISLNFNNAHVVTAYNIVFNDKNEIVSFEKTGAWIS